MRLREVSQTSCCARTIRSRVTNCSGDLVNPTILKESEAQSGFGMIPVEGWKVGQAYKRAILGAQTGRVYKVD